MSQERKNVLTLGQTKSIILLRYEGGIQMARTGRPKANKPFDHKVTVKFKEEEYQIMVEYAETHNLSISQLIRMGVELQMKQQANQ